jgi:outer membrane protein TolC
MKKIMHVVLCLVVFSATAQQKLSLSEAINTALQNSYDLKLAKNNLAISTINNHPGVAGALPTVTATGSDNEQITSINQKFSDPSRDTKRDNVGSNNLTMGVTGSILLSNGYRVVTTKKRLEQLQAQNKDLLDAQIQSTIAAVSTKYFDVVRQQSYRKTLQQSIEVAKKKLEILQVRKDVGLSNQADLYQAQVDLNALIQSQQAQELVIEQAITDLQNLIFMKPGTPVLISDTIIVDRSVNMDSVRNHLTTHPLIAAADKQIRINEFIEKETAALRYPTVRASTGYNFSSSKSAAGFTQLNQSYGPFVGINLSIPIYAGTVSRRQQQVAEINTRNAVIQRDDLLLSYENGMVRTYQGYQSTLTQLETEKKNYQLSIQLLDLVLQKFQLGQATIIDVKLAQQSFENEGYRLINLTYVAKAAEIELKRLAGQLTP